MEVTYFKRVCRKELSFDGQLYLYEYIRKY